MELGNIVIDSNVDSAEVDHSVVNAFCFVAVGMIYHGNKLRATFFVVPLQVAILRNVQKL